MSLAVPVMSPSFTKYCLKQFGKRLILLNVGGEYMGIFILDLFYNGFIFLHF